MAEWILLALSAYLTLGFAHSVLFLVRGVAVVDSAAVSMPWRVRLLILPGCMALWPVLLIKWQRALGPRRPQEPGRGGAS